LDEIREKIWSRAVSQANELPSVDAICLHTRALKTIHMDKARGAKLWKTLFRYYPWIIVDGE